MKEPEIVIERGIVSAVATAGSGVKYRVIDIDTTKSGDEDTPDMPAPKPVLKDEGELSDIILSNIHLLTCFNCGKALKDVPSRHRVGVEEAGVLCIDPGRINYPREPDEPAQAYFECMDCRGLENGH